MRKLVKNNVYWVGVVDWELQKFHGDEYSTHHGSTYNSYLIKEEKTVLIDTVWMPFAEEFVENLAREIGTHIEKNACLFSQTNPFYIPNLEVSTSSCFLALYPPKR